ATQHRSDTGNEVRRLIASLVDRRGVLVTNAVVDREIIFGAIGVLPVCIEWITLPVGQGRTGEKARSVEQAGGEIRKGLEIERAARRTVQKSPRFFPANMESVAERVLGSAERGDPRHIVEQFPGICDAALGVVVGSAKNCITAGD